MPTRSRLKADRPVALPAGLARLATRPLPTGSVASAKTIGILNVARFAASAGPVAQVTIRSRSPSRIRSRFLLHGHCVLPPTATSICRLRPSIQPSSPSRCTRTESHGPPTEEVDAPRNRVFALLLLRARRKRPRRRHATEQRDELASFHSITSSARASRIGGTSRPSLWRL